MCSTRSVDIRMQFDTVAEHIVAGVWAGSLKQPSVPEADPEERGQPSSLVYAI